MSLFDMKKKTMSILGISLFTVIGTYNAVVINSESSISGADARFVKRLDEIYGVTEYARGAASTTHWTKLQNSEVQTVKVSASSQKQSRSLPSITRKTVQESAPAVSAAVQETLDLKLVEVINNKKWQNGLKETQFNGNLATNNGVIETLDVALPDGAGLSVSFSEMNGNVFEYDLDGQLYSGMMYQVDANSYMVTLTTGPLEGTRLRFTGAPSVEQEQANQDALAEAETKDERNLGNDGSDTAQAEVASAEPAQVAEDAYNRDLEIQQNMQMQAQEAPVEDQTQGIFERLRNEQLGQPEQAQSENLENQSAQG